MFALVAAILVFVPGENHCSYRSVALYFRGRSRMNSSMPPGLTVEICDWDDDYVAVDIVATTERFSGKT